MEIEKEQMPEYSMLDDYYIIRTLGAGVSAKVKLAYKDESQAKVAIQVFKEQFSDIKLLEQEIVILKNLNHPNLVNMISYNLASKYLKKKDKRVIPCASITMEFVSGGELFDFITQTGRFSEKVCRFYFKQLMEALDYIHKMGLAHRDLKPDNLLLDDQFNLKITDFGMTGFLSGANNTGQMQTYCGTLNYMAPEIIMKKEYQGKSVDLFACAKILFILLTGIPPFPTAALSDKFYALIQNNRIEQFWTVHTKFQQGKNIVFSNDFQELVSALWSFDPTKRPNSEQIRNSAWYQQESATSDEVQADFIRRKQILEEEKERIRIQKQEQKGFATGGFRSTEQKDFKWKNEELTVDDDLEERYQLTKSRKSKPYDPLSQQKSDLVTLVEPASLMQYLLVAKQKLGNEVEIDPEFNSLIFKVSDSENPEFPVEFSYQVDVVSAPEDETLVQFQLLSGDYIEYLVRIEDLRSEISQL